MSIEAVSAVLHHSRQKGARRAVLIAIAWHMPQDPREGCYPSYDRLAAMSGYSRRQTIRIVHELVEAGEIEYWAKDGDVRRNYAPNRYYILIDCPEDCDGSLNHKRLSFVLNRAVDKSGESVDNFSPEVTKMTSRGDKNDIQR